MPPKENESDNTVPLSELLRERAKRQEAERKLAEAEQDRDNYKKIADEKGDWKSKYEAEKEGRAKDAQESAENMALAEAGIKGSAKKYVASRYHEIMADTPKGKQKSLADWLASEASDDEIAGRFMPSKDEGKESAKDSGKSVDKTGQKQTPNDAQKDAPKKPRIPSGNEGGSGKDSPSGGDPYDVETVANMDVNQLREHLGGISQSWGFAYREPPKK